MRNRHDLIEISQYHGLYGSIRCPIFALQYLVIDMETTAVKAGAYTHHLQFLSPAPEELARFYGRLMDMTVSRLGEQWMCRGPGRRILFAEGPAKSVGYMAMACRDRDGLDSIRDRATRSGIEISKSSSSLLTEGFAVCDPVGNVMLFGLADQEEPMQGIRGPLQHFNIRAESVEAIEEFYVGKLGFAVSDRVRDSSGGLTTSFMRSNHEHHTLGCFRAAVRAFDHHSYEAGEWIVIRDWCDHFAKHDVQVMWGPGRHGPGNNLFVFIVDPDGNWIEVSAELEVMLDRPLREWPHGERTLNLWGKAILRS